MITPQAIAAVLNRRFPDQKQITDEQAFQYSAQDCWGRIEAEMIAAHVFQHAGERNDEFSPLPEEWIDADKLDAVFMVAKFEIAKLELWPGDVLVVKMSEELANSSPKPFQAMENFVRRAVGPDVPVLVIDCHIDLSVLTKAEVDARIEQPRAPRAPRAPPKRIIELPDA